MRQVVVASPYAEASISAMARAMLPRGALKRFYTTLVFGGQIVRVVDRLPFRASKRLASRLMRRNLGLPAALVEAAGQWAEIRRLVTNKLPNAQANTSRLMYLAKDSFDSSVARKLKVLDFDAVIGTFASASATLGMARRSNRLTVLNFVNSYPAYHNYYLKELAHLDSWSHELITERVAKKVDQELNAADIILVPSRFVARQLVDAGIPAERLTLIPYGVDQAKFRPLLREQRRQNVQCLYAGQISYRKGVHCLLAVARMLATVPVEFILVGPLVSPEILAGMPDNVRWRGTVGHEVLSAVMSEADIFVLPSLEDAYGLVASEAMASGLATIVSVNAGAAELITDGHDGLIVAPADIYALRDAVLRLVDDPILRERLGKAAYETSRKALTWDEYGAKVLTTIDAKLGSRAISRAVNHRQPQWSPE